VCLGGREERAWIWEAQPTVISWCLRRSALIAAGPYGKDISWSWRYSLDLNWCDAMDVVTFGDTSDWTGRLRSRVKRRESGSLGHICSSRRLVSPWKIASNGVKHGSLYVTPAIGSGEAFMGKAKSALRCDASPEFWVVGLCHRGQLSSRSQSRFPIKPRFPEPVRIPTVTTSRNLRDLYDYAFAMAALTFIPYKPSVSIPKDPSAEGFRPIGDFSKPCDELAKSASQPTNRLVNQQRDQISDNVHDRKFPAVFQDPFRGQSEYTTQWLRDELFPDCADYVERKDDGSSKVQSRGDCQGEHELSTL